MKKWRWILLGSITLLGAAFWGLNFCIAANNTKSEKNITTARMGDGLPDAMQRREKINLVLVGEGPLIAALPKALTVEMKSAGIADLELVQGMEPRYQSPVLVINVGKPGWLWTPFFAASQFTIQTGYSSAGDTTFMGETPIILDNREGPAVKMSGEYKVSDRSWGVISRPGYYQHLADHLAGQIVSTLKDLYRVSTAQCFEGPRVKQNDPYGNAGRRIPYLAQPVDLFATVLDGFNIPLPEGTPLHTMAAFGRCGESMDITDGEWTLYLWPPSEKMLPSTDNHTCQLNLVK